MLAAGPTGWEIVSSLATVVAAIAAAAAAVAAAFAARDSRGPATAKKVTLHGDPLPQHLDPETLPTELRPFQLVALRYRPIPAQAGERTTRLTWVDSAGNEQSLDIPRQPITLAAGRTARERMAELREISLRSM